MAKITVEGQVYEGTPEELRDIFEMFGVKFPSEEIEEDTLKVGDLVRNVSGVWADKGVFGKITEVDESDFDHMPYCVKFETENVPLWVKVEDIEKATEEEVAELGRKQAEKGLEGKWAKIGRKPNEFKEGDIVKVVSSDSYNGVVGEITDIGNLYLGIYSFDGKFHGPFKETAQLIAPVESRFDEAK